jgi:hypothetical protein
MAEQKVELRCYSYIDRMQPQFASYFAKTARGYLPKAGQAALFLEIAPGMPINRITDVAVKATSVTVGELIVERSFGFLEIHHDDQAEVMQAGKAILEYLGITEADRIKPSLVTNQIIKRVNDYHAMLVNRTTQGMLLVRDQSLYIGETVPAGYAAFAANEAEKAADINIISVIAVGRFGRYYIGGTEAEVQAALQAATVAINSLEGRPDTGGRGD